MLNNNVVVYSKSHFPEVTRQIKLKLKTFPEILQTEAYLAGGVLTSLFSGSKIRDYDFFFQSESSFKKVKEAMEKDFSVVFETKRAITFQVEQETIQLIKIIAPPSELFKHFDYTICMCAYDFKNFYMHERFLYDLGRRRLVFNPETLYPISSLVRLKKYLHRGFIVSDSTLIMLSFAIRNIKIETLGDLADQLEGIDVVLLMNFVEMLKKRGKERIVISALLDELLSYIFEGIE